MIIAITIAQKTTIKTLPVISSKSAERPVIIRYTTNASRPQKSDKNIKADKQEKTTIFFDCFTSKPFSITRHHTTENYQ